MSIVSMVKHRRDGAHLPSKHLGDWCGGVILGCRPAQSTEKPKTGVGGDLKVQASLVYKQTKGVVSIKTLHKLVVHSYMCRMEARA